jgi:hypothetical protein
MLKGKGEKFAKKLLVGDYIEYRYKVAKAYKEVYKTDELAEVEFNKNYGLLKILDSHESFVIPEIQEYKKVEVKEIELPFNL